MPTDSTLYFQCWNLKHTYIVFGLIVFAVIFIDSFRIFLYKNYICMIM